MIKYIAAGFAGATLALIVIYLGAAWYFKDTWR